MVHKRWYEYLHFNLLKFYSNENDIHSSDDEVPILEKFNIDATKARSNLRKWLNFEDKTHINQITDKNTQDCELFNSQRCPICQEETRFVLSFVL